MHHPIERLPLIRSAQAELRQRHLLIEAPAGFGKTILLQQLMRYLPGAAYLPLSADDNDVAVLRRRVHESGGDPLLVDDVHVLVTGGEAAAWLREQLETAQPQWLMVGRFLPFDVVLLEASGAIARWDGTRLRFPTATTAQLLQDGNAAQLNQAVAGWPLGVGLLRQLPPERRRVAVAREQLFDYLARSVFETLSAGLQRFLSVTAAPILFSAELASFMLDASPGDVDAWLQIARRRNLFIYPADRDGTYRYHELFRDFLRSRLDAESRRTLAGAAVDHFVDAYPYEQATPLAVEQALDAGLHERAAEMLLEIRWPFLHESNRYRTFERWVMSLNPAVRDGRPALYWMAGHCLIFLSDREQDAFDLFDRSEALALEAGDQETVYAARFERAHQQYMLDGADSRLVEQLREIVDNAPRRQIANLRARRTLATLQAELGDFAAGRRTWHAAYRQAVELEVSELSLQLMRRQYALYILIPLGEYAEARAIFQETIGEVGDSPGDLLEVLTNYCDLLLPMGAWDEMEVVLRRIERLVEELDDVADYVTIWIHFYAGMLAVARGEPRRAAAELDGMHEDDESGIQLISERVGRIALARLQSRPDPIDRYLSEVRSQRREGPYHVAWAHLEADIARGLAAVKAGEPYAVSEETLALYRFRARGDLLRLRALLTILCYAQRNRRWRRMAGIVLRELARPHYPELLTRRDPELGAYFWRILLQERRHGDAAAKALVEIGLVEPLLPLLEHDNQAMAIRLQTADILARIGDERAMPALYRAARAEKDKRARASLRQALTALEEAPPPPLRIALMDGFRVQRGQERITDFYRPVVERLLQYFALRRGRTLHRDQILEDLWPEKAPDKAWTTYRTVYSFLRSALEPHMRSKGPNRYFALDGSSYVFDPQGHVTTDVEEFEAVVTAALADPAPFSAATIAQLRGYARILPDLPYADWLLDTRQRLHELYLNGALRLGQELLARGETVEAQQWAQTLIGLAPWQESAYQLLMRAYARQDQRATALRVYAEARAALERELAVAPSPLTEWLRQRLEEGESI